MYYSTTGLKLVSTSKLNKCTMANCTHRLVNIKEITSSKNGLAGNVKY